MPLQVTVVREVSAELVGALGRLLPQLSAAAVAPDTDTLRAVVARPGVRLLVAIDGSAVLGTLTLVTYATVTGTRAWIEDVVVDAAARGRGVGVALTRTAVDLARADGAPAVDLTSRPERVAANRLYQREGFVRRETNVYRYTF